MKNKFLFAFILCFLLSGLNLHSAEKVKMYFFSSEPDIYLDEITSEPKGAFYDYMQIIAPEMGIQIEWSKEYTAIPRMITILQQTPNTAIALLSKTDERAAIMAYTETPYAKDVPCLVVLKENKLNKINTVEDILDLNIGYAKDGFLPPFMRDNRIKLSLVSDPNYHKINLKNLVMNRVDAVFGPVSNTMLVLSKQLNILNKVKILALPEVPTPFYVIFSKKSPELAEKYNMVFKKLDGQKIYKQIQAKYLD